VGRSVFRILVASTEPGRALPVLANEVLQDEALRARAVSALEPLFPELTRGAPVVRLEAGEGAAGAGAVAVVVEHPEPDAALTYARWLADALRGEITVRFLAARDRDRRTGTGSEGIPAPQSPDDFGITLDREIAREREAIDDLRAERRVLREEQLRLWGLISQARGRVDAIRKRLTGVPPISVVRKKLLEDLAFTREFEDRPLDDPSRILAWNVEEEIPNPLYAHLTALETEAIAEGTGYQTRLDEVGQEIDGVDREIERSRSTLEGLELESGQSSMSRSATGGEPNGEALEASAPSRVPVQVLSPVAPRYSIPAPDSRVLRLSIGTFAGALAGWIAAFLLSLPAARGRRRNSLAG